MLSEQFTTRKYTRLLRRLEKKVAKRASRLGPLSVARLSSFLAIVVLPFALRHYFSWSGPLLVLVVAAGVLCFGAAFFLYERAHSRLQQAQRHQDSVKDLLQRLAEDWPDQLPIANHPVSAQHPYASDLGLLGRFSLGQLLDRTWSPFGRSNLYRLLLEDEVEPARIRERQEAVGELANKSVLRARLQRGGRSPGIVLPGEHLALERFLAGPDITYLNSWVWPARLLPLLTLGSYVAFSTGFGEAYYLVTLPVQVLVFALFQWRAGSAVRATAEIADSLRDLEEGLRVMEGLRPRSALLTGLTIFTKAGRPYAMVRALSRAAGLLALRRNPLAHVLLGVFLFYDLHLLAHALRLRPTLREQLPRWTEEAGLVEALCSLADYNCLHTSNVQPTLQPQGASDLLACTELRHPLLPGGRAVGNTLSISTTQPIWLISGSNMSGKSTLLRSVGLAIVLARAGAKVPATEFRFRPAHLFSAMNVTDDLSDSASLFHAEVRRIKALLDLAQTTPVLFLADEVLRGTNERERHIAVRGILALLVRYGAAGLSATHDTRLIAELCGQDAFHCAHFREEITPADEMTFDYTLRDGPVRSSNALRLLRINGIDLPEPDPAEQS